MIESLTTVESVLQMLATVRGTDDGWVSREWIHSVAQMGLDALPDFGRNEAEAATFLSQFRDIAPLKSETAAGY